MKKTLPLSLLILSLSTLSGNGHTFANTPNPNIAQIGAKEQQAQTLYEQGQYQQAINILQQLTADYQNNGNIAGRATALRNLSLAYQSLGQLETAGTAIDQSLELLQQLPNTSEKTRLLALAWESQGQLQLALGQPENALETWKQAAISYENISDTTGMARSHLNQAQAMQSLGLYRLAIKTLTDVTNSLKDQPDTIVKAKAQQSLGDAYRAVGNLTESETALNTAVIIAKRLQIPEAIAAAYLSYGNTKRLQQNFTTALDFYQRAANSEPILNAHITRVEALLNQLSLLADLDKLAANRQIAATDIEAIKAKISPSELTNQIKAQLQVLSPSRATIYAKINLAKHIIELSKSQGKTETPASIAQEAAQQLATAIKQAQTINDKRAEAYATGSLGGLYEQLQQWQEAQQLTSTALIQAQALGAPDITYQWQWQLGRILQVQGKRQDAIIAYSQAVETLQSLRSDLVAISSDVQFSFRESVEPIYRELVSILLQPGAEISQKELKQARSAIELLQLAELDNFFRDACLDAKPAQIDQVDKNAAVFYPIILQDRLEVIAAFPGQPLRHYTTTLPKAEIDNTLKDMQDAIIIPRLQFSVKNFTNPSQKVYDWLIRPIETELAASGIETLVFVPDGGFRNIPLIGLYDGKQYLAQKYSVALTPGLQLLDPKPLAREKLQILAAGLTEARQDFSPLPGVEAELKRIQAQAPTNVLLNADFTNASFKAAVNSYPFPVVHLATHGEFSSYAEDTFVLTWDSRINANELDSLLRSDNRQTKPIELLVLSACKTASGDDRAALGLAGVAVRAGARSTLASLWYVSDAATSLLMTKFYEELANTEITKAEALRRAQAAVLQEPEFAHPYFWSAFVLVGNWL
ncbi:MAG TPA: CHAT domain-containing protein [Oscillatoriaceae cyanobacterium M33_DOE_052]|uniref:CHAT domain-containing protein n=1 Tax=Planktothricoides sp. SpSt-374 TaxID=2282167 RepID=A0A7C3ZXA7_9CYAN|nr:CHAT domain-containing protein [Oscillatoriaceae cyanobacterium M33_DOE_052]